MSVARMINHDHFQALKACFDDGVSQDALLDHLQLVLILTDEAVHPRVAWSPVQAQAV